MNVLEYLRDVSGNSAQLINNYLSVNEQIRIMFTGTRAGLFDHQVDLSPNYPEDPKIGVVVGTYGSPAYIDMQLYFLKNINHIDNILIHDDCSGNTDLIKLAKQYNVDFYSTPVRSFKADHISCGGDELTFINGLNWAKQKNLDILIKLSTRMIICFNWVDNFKKLVLKSDGLTFGSYCTTTKIPLRTECVAMNVNAWSNDIILNTLRFYVDNQIPICAEIFYNNLAMQIEYQNRSEKYLLYKNNHKTNWEYSGYVHWYDGLETNRFNIQNKNILTYFCRSVDDFYQKSVEIFKYKYTINDFKL